MSEEEELESSSSIMFSPVYVKLHTQCRCGDVSAFNELQRMSEENDNLAKGFLSLVYNSGLGVVIPYSRYEARRLMEGVINWLLDKGKEDEYDSAHAWYLLGACYLKILGVSKLDHVEAVEYYKLAAEKGHSLAQCALGNCYDDGVGIKQSMQKAISYYELSAAQGHPIAQCNLGKCYEHGDGCEKDMNKAAYYYKLAAGQNYADALYNLSICYLYKHEGVELNYERGVELCERAAAQGDLDSLFFLSRIYLKHVPHVNINFNPAKAFQYALSAADRHHAHSQVVVAGCYGKGTGVCADVIEAVRYARRAQKYYKEGMYARYNRTSEQFDEKYSEKATKILSELEDEYRAQVSCCSFILLVNSFKFV